MKERIELETNKRCTWWKKEKGVYKTVSVLRETELYEMIQKRHKYQKTGEKEERHIKTEKPTVLPVLLVSI